MMEAIILKIGLMVIDWLIVDAKERAESKKRLIEATRRYNESVTDSVLIRREWDELKRGFDVPQK
jgi:hypothetical protein